MIIVHQGEVSHRQDNKLNQEGACYGGNMQLNKIIGFRLKKKKKKESPAPGFHAV
jgi:hypothetical protein